MATDNIWDDDRVSELDLVEEAAEAEAIAEQNSYEPTIVQAEEEELEEIAEESSFDLDKDESNIIYNARIRLEQAKLYEMLINHNIFEGVTVDARAVEIVSNELKHYIVKRLEILMGLRQPAVQRQEESIDQLNDVELDFIKQLAYKGTLGKSAQSEPVRRQSGGLKSMGMKKPSPSLKNLEEAEPEFLENQPAAAAPAPRKRRAKAKAKTSPLRTRPRAGIKKQRVAPETSRKKIRSPHAGKRDLNQAEIDELAREDIELMKGRKDFDKMTAKEKRQEMLRVGAIHAPKALPNTQRAPMANPDQMATQYMAQQNRRSDLVGGGKVGGFDAIMSNLATKIAMERSSGDSGSDFE